MSLLSPLDLWPSARETNAQMRQGSGYICKSHRVKGYFNVVSKACEGDGYAKIQIPSYGLVRGKVLSCTAHKLTGYFMS